MLSALVSVSPLAVGAWLFAPRTPTPRRDPATTPLFADGDTCTGPRLRTQTVPDLRAPGGEREAICGFVSVGTTHYAWTRHALFMRHDEWELVAHSPEAVQRVVALPNGGFVVVNHRHALLEPEYWTDRHDLVPVKNELLVRFDLARADARRDGHPAPPSPLRCLATAAGASLSLYKSHSCTDPGAFAVRVSVGALGAEVTADTSAGVARPIAATEARAELARVQDALFLEEVEFAHGGVHVAWSCDDLEQSMSVAGTRAHAIHAIARSWR